MTVKGMLFAGAVLAALSGCATDNAGGERFAGFDRLFPYRLVPRADFKKCNPNAANCNVFVDVTSCTISTDPKTLLVEEKNRRVSIHWKLPGNSPHSFRERDGIEVIDAKKGEFNCTRDNNPRHFTCINEHTEQKPYKYWVRLDGTCNGRPIPELDPYIIND